MRRWDGEWRLWDGFGGQVTLWDDGEMVRWWWDGFWRAGNPVRLVAGALPPASADSSIGGDVPDQGVPPPSQHRQSHDEQPSPADSFILTLPSNVEWLTPPGESSLDWSSSFFFCSAIFWSAKNKISFSGINFLIFYLTIYIYQLCRLSYCQFQKTLTIIKIVQ